MQPRRRGGIRGEKLSSQYDPLHAIVQDWDVEIYENPDLPIGASRRRRQGPDRIRRPSPGAAGKLHRASRGDEYDDSGEVIGNKCNRGDAEEYAEKSYRVNTTRFTPSCRIGTLKFTRTPTFRSELADVGGKGPIEFEGHLLEPQENYIARLAEMNTMIRGK